MSQTNKLVDVQEMIAEKFNPEDLAPSKLMAHSASPVAFMPQSFAELMEFGKLMAVSAAIPAHLRGKPADCLQVTMQAARWGMDPWAVANKSYFVNDRIAYEAQMVNAVIYASSILNGRLRISYSGEGQSLVCIVSGVIRGETEPHTVEQGIATITTKNSPLWKQAPKQQLAYYTTRLWVRLYTPDLLLGVYVPDELEPLHRGPDAAKDVTPKSAPKREDFVQPTTIENTDIFVLTDEYGEELSVHDSEEDFIHAAIDHMPNISTVNGAMDSFVEFNEEQLMRLGETRDSELRMRFNTAVNECKQAAKAQTTEETHTGEDTETA